MEKTDNEAGKINKHEFRMKVFVCPHEDHVGTCVFKFMDIFPHYIINIREINLTQKKLKTEIVVYFYIFTAWHKSLLMFIDLKLKSLLS